MTKTVLSDLARCAAERVIDHRAETCQEAVDTLNQMRSVGERIPEKDIPLVCQEAERLYQSYLKEHREHPERFGDSY